MTNINNFDILSRLFMNKYILLIIIFILNFNLSWAEVPGELLAKLDSQDVNEQLDACLALGRLGDQEAVPYLKSKLGNKSMLIRHAAANALARIGGEQVKEIFQNMVQNGGVEARRVGLAGLAMAGDQQSMEIVLAQLDSESWQVRWSAVYALGERGYRSALPKLAEIAAKDAYQNKNTETYPVRDQAKTAIEKINCFIEWYDTLEDAWLVAEKLKRPLLIYWRVDNSNWCRQMEEGIFFSPKVADLTQQFVCLQVDVTESPVLVAQYDVSGAPCILVLDREGQEADRMLGLVSRKKLLQRLEQILKGTGTPGQWKKKIKKDPADIESSWHLAQWYMDNGQTARAVPLLKSILDNDQQNQSGYRDNAQFILGYSLGEQGKYQEAVGVLEQLVKDYPRFPEMEKALYCLGLDYLGVGRVDQARKIFNRILAEYPAGKVSKQAKKILTEIGEKHEEV